MSQLNLSQTRNWIKWIEALESGKYVQIKNWLYKGRNAAGQKQMCCLGVACDVAVKGYRWMPDIALGLDFFSIDRRSGNLPTSAQTLFGLDDLGYLPRLGKTLSGLNDSFCDGRYTAVLPHIRRHLRDYGHKSLRKKIEKLIEGRDVA